MTLTKLLAAAVLLALAVTVLLDARWIRRRKFGPAIGITTAFIAFSATLYAVLMEFITRT